MRKIVFLLRFTYKNSGKNEKTRNNSVIFVVEYADISFNPDNSNALYVMKKLFYFGAILLLSLCMGGCIEINEDYDLTKISKENITIGDEFIAPIAKVTTSIADMNLGDLGDIEDIFPKNSVMKAAAEDSVIAFEQTYPIVGAIDQSIIDMLTAQGDLYLLVDLENYTPIFFEGYARFHDAEGNVVCDPLGTIQIEEGTNEVAAASRLEIQITAADLNAIGTAKSISVYYKTNIASYTPKAEDVIVLTFKTKKTGGIALGF